MEILFSSTYAVIDFLAGFVSVFLAILTLVKTNIRSKVNISIGILALSIAAFCFIDAFRIDSFNDYDACLFWTRMTWSTSFIVATLVFYSYSIFDKRTSLMFVMSLYLPALLFAVIAHTGYGVKEIISFEPFRLSEGRVVDLFRLWLFLDIIFAIYQFVKNYRSIIPEKKLQFQYFIFGLSMSSILALVFGVIIPYFGNISYIPLVPSMILIWVIFASYSVIKEEKLQGIEVLAYEVTRFLMLLVIVTGFNYLFVRVCAEMLHLNVYLSVSLSVLVIGMTFFALPVKKSFDNALKNMLLNRRIKYQKFLNECSRALVCILNIDELLEYVMDSIHRALGNRKIGIFLKEGQKFRLVASRELADNSINYLDSPHLIKFMETNKSPLILDTAWKLFSDFEYKKIIDQLGLFGAVMVMPLVYKEELVGIITLDQKKSDGSVFDIDDIEILQDLSYELAIAIENAKLYKQIEDTYMDITRALSIAVEEKEGYTIGHSDNVTKIAIAIAKKMQLSHKQIIDVTQASMLHDIGKIGIHENILLKPGKLNDEEWEEMKSHAEKGAKILAPLHMSGVSDIVVHHHERFDGKGYPEGLRGENIPIGAQILSVADSFDAMISERPYRASVIKKLTVEDALQELINNKETQFNPSVVDAFIEVLKENQNILRKDAGSKLNLRALNKNKDWTNL